MRVRIRIDGVGVGIAPPLARMSLVPETRGTASRGWDWKWIGQAGDGSASDGVVR